LAPVALFLKKMKARHEARLADEDMVVAFYQRADFAVSPSAEGTERVATVSAFAADPRG
jgi:hypothetical protein